MKTEKVSESWQKDTEKVQESFEKEKKQIGEVGIS